MKRGPLCRQYETKSLQKTELREKSLIQNPNQKYERRAEAQQRGPISYKNFLRVNDANML